eukprot:14038118-Ditylum_brightwellii.AAC.1
MNGALEGARGLMILSDPQAHVTLPDRSVISDTPSSDANDSFESHCTSDEMEELINKQNQESLHHKHIAKQCSVGKVIRYKGNDMEDARFFIDDIKKDIVVWV